MTVLPQQIAVQEAYSWTRKGNPNGKRGEKGQGVVVVE